MPNITTNHAITYTNNVWETNAEILYKWWATTKIWIVLLIGHAAREICFSQSVALPRSGQWCIIMQLSMEFLWSFLRCHFVGKPVVVSWTFGCFSQAKCSEFEQVVWTYYLECARGTHLVFWVTIFGEIIVWWVRSVLAGTSFRGFAVGDAFHLGAVHCYMYITWNFYDLFSLSSLLLTFENSALLPGACKLTAEHNRLQDLNKEV